jgi:quinol monooxygenase YgiN
MVEKIFGIVRLTVKPGEAGKFRETAQLLLEAAKQDLTGTQAYEWFMAPDGHECTVIEIYDGAEALAHHSKIVGKMMPALQALANVEIEFAGDLPAELLEIYRKRLGNVGYAGPRLLGKLHGAAPGIARATPGGKIFALARFSVLPGQEKIFRELAEDCFALVDRTEPGTSGYEWFLNDAGTECLTLDIYDDAAALTAHMTNAGPKMAKILGLVRSDVQIFGAVPSALVAKLKPGLGTRFAGEQFQGIL